MVRYGIYDLFYEGRGDDDDDLSPLIPILSYPICLGLILFISRRTSLFLPVLLSPLGSLLACLPYVCSRNFWMLLVLKRYGR